MTHQRGIQTVSRMQYTKLKINDHINKYFCLPLLLINLEIYPYLQKALCFQNRLSQQTVQLQLSILNEELQDPVPVRWEYAGSSV